MVKEVASDSVHVLIGIPPNEAKGTSNAVLFPNADSSLQDIRPCKPEFDNQSQNVEGAVLMHHNKTPSFWCTAARVCPRGAVRGVHNAQITKDTTRASAWGWVS